ncbi:GerAB/ArcD/ProY family transporter [Paenibacillus kobensis]|uniref:GerAB/ArcD/ProY family transporter n=1 Tax=Paenibacillus kobensis TaxID=59841 RepID=UPI000FD852B6|nr:GerAB/ArcD/ProY family transporter [Paenibacillus kobensis]
MQRIGTHQLYVGIIMFILGNTPLYELGVKARQNAPLAMLVGSAAGLLLAGMYLWLYRRAPEAGLTELYRLHFGMWLGSAIALMHATEQGYEAMNQIWNYADLTSLTLLGSAPAWLIKLIACLLSTYTVIKGVEVLFRVIELLFPLTLASYLLIAAMLYLNKLPDWHLLMPFVGFDTIVRAAIPQIMVFPFGQIITFLAIWQFANETCKVTRTTLLAYMTVTVMLVYGNAVIMSVLGPQMSSGTFVPLLEVVQLIQLGGFIERLDIIVTLLLFFGLYVKLSVLYMATVLLIQPVLRCSWKACAWGVGGLLFAATFVERNYAVHIWNAVHILMPYNFVFEMAIPAVMLVIGARRVARKAAMNRTALQTK